MIDTHCHLNSAEYIPIFNDIVNEIKTNNIEKVIVPSINWESIKEIQYLSKKYDFIYSAYGIHPEECKDDTVTTIENGLEPLLKNGNMLGEVGLDYHNIFAPIKKQKEIFEVQLSLAEKHQVPIIIHSREAFNDTMSILSNFKHKNIVFHCFSYGVEEARKVLDRGYYISFTGIITFKKADIVRDVVDYLPVDRIMAETDGPYLAPVPFRGRLNHPLYVKYVIEKIAEIKNIPFNEMDSILTRNWAKFAIFC